MNGALTPDEYFDLFLDAGEPSGAAVFGSAPGPIALWNAWWHARVSDDRVGTVASRQGFVLKTADLAALGVTRARARTRMGNGRWTAAGRGVVSPVDIRGDLPDVGADAVLGRRRHALHSASAVLRRPEEVVSGRSGAVLHGLPTFAVPRRPELTAPLVVGLGPRADAHMYGATLFGDDLTNWFGAEVTTVARTLVDLARHDRWDGIMAVDAGLRECCVDPGEITRSLESARGWPGIRRAREVLGLGDARAESPLESVVRLRLHDDGFPPPELQYWIDHDRVDFYWPKWRFVLEADGRGKYSDDALWREKEREQRLRRVARRIERVIWSDVTRGWPRTSAMLRSALC